jgi:ubiquitin-like 1-activating enzyme E1 A
MFYAGGTYGLLGYIFCDLQKHDYIAPYVCAGF